MTPSSFYSLLSRFKKYRKNPAILVLSFILILAGGITTFSFLSQNTTSGNDIYEVVRGVDGDTIVVKDSTGKESTVRYLYVDTPETVKPNTPVQCYGHEASDFNKNLIAAKKVKLEVDVEDEDVYHRLLRYVYVDQNNDGKYDQDEMVNEILLKQGYAHIYHSTGNYKQKNVRYKELFDKTELEAKQQKLGLWGKCPEYSSGVTTTVTPIFPPTTTVTKTADVLGANAGLKEKTDSCVIKGNVNTSGDKIYHMPGQRYYDKTQLNIDEGDRWFCNESDAQSAGFRKSKV